LGWNGAEFVLELIPPSLPIPDWVEFGRLMLIDTDFNQFYQQLLPLNPLLAGSLQVALSQASLGRAASFAMVWSLVVPNIVLEHKSQWAGYAQICNLPSDFIDILLS
jgi:hypothetical protein